jgi:transposase
MAKSARSSRSRGPRVPHQTNPTPPVLHPDAAGIDLGATHLYAALPPDRTAQPVRVFETFTQDLYALAAWLKEHRITTVAMESTGVYWIPVFQVLETCGIEVYLVNAHHAKNVPGRKTDVSDCQWRQYLHAVGLLRGSFRPPDEICAVRSLLRHRSTLVAQAAAHVQPMQKSLIQMNLQRQHVLSDLSGQSGLAMIDAMLAGERDPARLAQLRDPRVKASKETICKALVGDWRPEHLFTLGQALASYRHCQRQIGECDAEIERRFSQLRSQVDPTQTPPPQPKPSQSRPRKGEIVLQAADLRTERYRVLGTDATQIPGLGTGHVSGLVGELGPDLSAFPTGAHFVNWLGVCPNPQISGGRVLKRGTRDVKNRGATLFRMAAQSLHHDGSALGAFYRRMRAKLGAPKAITATAHKLARIYYHLVTTKEADDESVFAKNEEREAKRRVERLKREATALGFVLSSEGLAA